MNELSLPVLKRFLAEAATRPDYPTGVGIYNPAADEKDIRVLAGRVLTARKGEAHGYGALLIAQCQVADELPPTIRSVLEKIHGIVSAIPEEPIVELPVEDAPG